MNQNSQIYKIKLALNSKVPACKGNWSKNMTPFPINLEKFNYGIPTGKLNNIIVVDLDLNKDDEPEEKSGINEFAKYLSSHDDPDTYTVRSRKGGLHFYFKYSHSDPNTKYKIDNYIKNSVGMREANIDIRTEGGYIVGAGSSIDGAFYTVVNDTDMKDIPDTLVDWLLENSRVKESSGYQCSSNLDISDDQIRNILKLLDEKFTGDSSFHTNYKNWLYLLTALKNLDKFDIFDEYSKQNNKKYNKAQNKMMWDANRGIIDINFIISILRNEGESIEFVKEKFQSIAHISPNSTLNIDVKTFNKMYVNQGLTFEDFKNSETLIIKSCTGTGKTTAINTFTNKLFSDPDHSQIKFISLVDKISLASQHFKSFQSINLQNYKTVDNNILLNSRSIVICINSLLRLESIEDFSDYIIYIDEISSFLKGLTENRDLDFALKRIDYLLNRMIKTAYKVIVSDAIINDAVFMFLTSRPKSNKLFITNEYKKFKGIPAKFINDEYNFLLKLQSHCANNKYFLFACDSKTKIEEFYYNCYNQATKANKEKFILIDVDHPFEIYDATEQFQDKFVFYSPSIVYGVDFNRLDASQDVFLYIKGSTLTPDLSYQQLTRTRNIKTVYIYCNVEDAKPVYEDLADCVQSVTNNISVLDEKIFNLCSYVDDDTNIHVIQNRFLNLYCYHLYIRDLYKSRHTEHLIDILKGNGFDVQISKSPKTFISKETREFERLEEAVKDVNEETFNAFLKASDQQREQDTKYKSLFSNISFLNLVEQPNEILETYKDIIINSYAVEDHINTIRLLKDDDYIKMKLNANKSKTYSVKNLSNTYTKIHLIRELEKSQGLKPFEGLTASLNSIQPISPELSKSLKVAFRKKDDLVFDSEKEFKKVYASLLRNIGTKDFISSEKSNKKATRDKIIYNLDEEYIKFHIGLDSYNNKLMTGYSLDALKILNIQKPERKELILKEYDLAILDNEVNK